MAGIVGLVQYRLRAKPTGSQFVGIKKQEVIPTKFTCKDDNLSPALEFTNIPSRAKALAVVVEDLDLEPAVKENNPWYAQWVMWNINPATKSVPEGTKPDGSIGRSIDGNYKYYGPCPDKGQTKRYRFSLYSLDEVLTTVNSSDEFTKIREAIEKHVITQDTMVVNYTSDI